MARYTSLKPEKNDSTAIKPTALLATRVPAPPAPDFPAQVRALVSALRAALSVNGTKRCRVASAPFRQNVERRTVSTFRKRTGLPRAARWRTKQRGRSSSKLLRSAGRARRDRSSLFQGPSLLGPSSKLKVQSSKEAPERQAPILRLARVRRSNSPSRRTRSPLRRTQSALPLCLSETARMRRLTSAAARRLGKFRPAQG